MASGPSQVPTSPFYGAILKRIVITLLAILALAGGFVAGFGQRVELVAEEDLVVSDAPIRGKPVGHIKRGERYAVTGCEDIKSYFLPIVRLGDREAFVASPGFTLTVKPAWDLSGGPVSFSCIGFA